ncbi:MAG: hypothetical protein J0H08_11280 [Rhizobiales bacterium]|nr:hypothetical protein [Hyphomicrobiales bacterium]
MARHASLTLCLAPCLALAAAAVPARAENASAYTRIDLDACRAIPPEPDDPLESGAWFCDGYRGLPVYVAEGDLRFFVSYGEGARDELAAATTLPPFNHIGETIEWRTAPDGAPVATILRFFTDPGYGGAKGQVLVVTKLGGSGQVCHAGYVDARANPDANAIARGIADGVAAFDCGSETPRFHGAGGFALSAPETSPPESSGNASAYTPLDLDQCSRTAPAADDPLQSVSWWCDGAAGIPVYVLDGDLRVFVSYGHGAPDERAARTTLPGFNHAGKTIEWRIGADGRPFATILRWFVAPADEGGPEGQTLVITKLGGPGQVCHMGYVDALVNPDANAVAREVADVGAADFDCEREQPLQYGLVGGDGDARE